MDFVVSVVIVLQEDETNTGKKGKKAKTVKTINGGLSVQVVPIPLPFIGNLQDGLILDCVLAIFKVDVISMEMEVVKIIITVRLHLRYNMDKFHTTRT